MIPSSVTRSTTATASNLTDEPSNDDRPTPTPYCISGSNKKHQPCSSSTSTLSMDRAAFLLIRIKRVFQKKKRKNNVTKIEKSDLREKKRKPPMLRARTLPAIITPALNILQAQLGSNKTKTSDYCAADLNEPSYQNIVELTPFGVSKSEFINSNCTNCNDPLSNSPRQSVSSNSSAGSTCKENSSKVKNNSFQKLTKLLSNNSNRILSSSSYVGLWSKGHGTLVQDDNHDDSIWPSNRLCFSWNTSTYKNEKQASSKNLKRMGSVDSLLSVHQSQMNAEYSDNWQVVEEFNASSATCSQRSSMTTVDIGTVSSSSHLIPSYMGHWSNKLTTCSTKARTHQIQSSTYYQQCKFPVHTAAGLSLGKRQLSVDINSVSGMDVSYGMKKSQRKKLEKLNLKFNFDQQALFSAVENENFERTRMIIESTDVDVNRTNSDGFTPLDIALMLLNIPLIKYLQSCGGHEGDLFTTRLSRELHLQSLLNEAERSLLDLSTCLHRQLISAHGTATVSNSGSMHVGTSSSSLSSALIKEKERQLMFWQRRLKLLQRLKKGFDLLQIPPPPLSVHVEVAGAQSLLVHFYPPIRMQDRRNIITKYKIEWSSNHFETIIGSAEVINLSLKHQFTIERLESKQCYQVRIASGNCKGYSEYCYPLINQSIPSTWRSIDKRHSIEMKERIFQIDQLFEKIVDWRRQQVMDMKNQRKSIELEQTLTINCGSGQGINPAGSQKKVRKSIKNFFGATNKFQKSMKRSGIYFASLIYHEQRVLVTNEEVLPLIEIDDIYPSTLQNDFYWLLKISNTWEDIKMFRKEMEKSHSSSMAHFRMKILLAIEQMQTSLGLINLGKLFYKPLRDSEATVVLCAIRSIDEPKMISCLSVRWLPMTKLQKRIHYQRENQARLSSEKGFDSGFAISGGNESGSPSPFPRKIGDILILAIDEMIQYEQACNSQLPPGLYIAYVKLKSSIDLMSLMVTKSHPNILPYAKIRENHHISRQEWAALKMCFGINFNVDDYTSYRDNSLREGTHYNRCLVTGTSQTQLQLAQSGMRDKKNLEQSNLHLYQLYSRISDTVSSLSPDGTGLVDNLVQLALQNWELEKRQNEKTCEQLVKITDNNRRNRLTFGEKLTFQQLIKFLQMLSQTSDHFLRSIGIMEDQYCHRIYTVEVIELQSKVSLILLLPPPDEVCSVTQCDDINSLVHSNSNLVYLPLKIFELIHMNTYQKHFTGQYWRISALLELDIIAAQQAQREAFSSSEVNASKAQLNQLLEFQTQLDEHCRSMRWIMDVVTCARDKQINAGISLTQLHHCLSYMSKQMMEEEEAEDHLFNIPAISFSAPIDFVPKINIQSECNSTPSSPPPNISSITLSRRKSRDDSYLQQHHRVQNRFHNLAHQRFHHNYQDCGKNGNHYDINVAGDLDESSEQAVTISFGSHEHSRSASLQSYSLPIELCRSDEDNMPVSYCKSSYSLGDIGDSHQCQVPDSLENHNILKDMRRCLSASRLIICPSKSDHVSQPLLQYDDVKSNQKNNQVETLSKDTDAQVVGLGNDPMEHVFDETCSLQVLSTDNLVQYWSDELPTRLDFVEQFSNNGDEAGSNQMFENITETKVEKDEEQIQLLPMDYHMSEITIPQEIIEDHTTKRSSVVSAQLEDTFTLSFNDHFGDGKNHYLDSFSGSSSMVVPNPNVSSLRMTRVVKHQIPSKKGKSKKKVPMLSTLGLLENFETSSRKRPEEGNSNNMAVRWIHCKWSQSCCSECCRPASDNESSTGSDSSNETWYSSSNDPNESNHKCCTLAGEHLSNYSHNLVVKSKRLQIYMAQECCLPRGTVIELEVSLDSLVMDIIQAVLRYLHSIDISCNIKGNKKKILTKSNRRQMNRKFEWQSYSLMAVYCSNIKHLNNDFPIDHLQSPWNNAKLWLQYNESG